jgi:hypothetical protein
MSDAYYQHMDGGVYRFISHAKSAEDGEVLAVYEHLYPFEKSIWVRDSNQFFLRFAPITVDDVMEILKKDKLEFQGEIETNKRQRRAREAATAMSKVKVPNQE